MATGSFLRGMLAGLLVALAPVSSAQTLASFSSAAAGEPPAPWRAAGFPTGRKPPTRFEITELDGSKVLRVEATLSYGTLTHALPAAPPPTGTRLRWRWRLDVPLLETDLRRKSGDDGALKVCVMFDLPMENISFVERNLLRMYRSVSDENLPTATLCYVWDHSLPAGTLLRNAFTSRVRMMVLDSGEQRLRQWVSHERDIAADFLQAFGHESATVPPMVAVLVAADADNTGGHSMGYVGDITFTPGPPERP